MAISRRQWILGAAGSASGIALARYAVPPILARQLDAADRLHSAPLIAEIEERTFRFFWERVNRENGLFPDRWPSPAPSSIAAVGFALTAYPIGVERGWITRDQARDVTLTTMRFFNTLPMGGAATGVAGYRGFYYHFLDINTGLRVGGSELSTVDTALLHMGILFASGWFDGEHPDEVEIRKLAVAIVDRAEWDWFAPATGGVSMGWHPDAGYIERRWNGYNEGMMVYLLALGSGGHPLKNGAWDDWTSSYDGFWRGSGTSRHLAFAPLFGHQYAECWVDYRGIFDAPMRAAGFDYFENSRRATYANRAYCIANPMHWDGYSRDIWGLTACDGPGAYVLPFKDRKAQFSGYSARGPVGQPDGYDDGTVAPTAALSSIAFAPEICIPAAVALRHAAGGRLYDQYGFKDAFNPSFRDSSKPVANGVVDPVHGWVGADYLGIDQGPILAMIANYRTETVWKVMRKVPHIVRGLRRAGFSGGWLDNA